MVDRLRNSGRSPERHRGRGDAGFDHAGRPGIAGCDTERVRYRHLRGSADNFERHRPSPVGRPDHHCDRDRSNRGSFAERHASSDFRRLAKPDRDLESDFRDDWQSTVLFVDLLPQRIDYGTLRNDQQSYVSQFHRDGSVFRHQYDVLIPGPRLQFYNKRRRHDDDHDHGCPRPESRQLEFHLPRVVDRVYDQRQSGKWHYDAHQQRSNEHDYVDRQRHGPGALEFQLEPALGSRNRRLQHRFSGPEHLDHRAAYRHQGGHLQRDHDGQQRVPAKRLDHQDGDRHIERGVLDCRKYLDQCRLHGVPRERRASDTILGQRCWSLWSSHRYRRRGQFHEPASEQLTADLSLGRLQRGKYAHEYDSGYGREPARVWYWRLRQLRFGVDLDHERRDESLAR